jgi:hypothetical protein
MLELLLAAMYSDLAADRAWSPYDNEITNFRCEQTKGIHPRPGRILPELQYATLLGMIMNLLTSLMALQCRMIHGASNRAESRFAKGTGR